MKTTAKLITGSFATIMLAGLLVAHQKQDEVSSKVSSITAIYAQNDDFSVKGSDSTPNEPYQPSPSSPEQGSGSECPTYMAPTWPVQVPVHICPPAEPIEEQPHAPEGEEPKVQEESEAGQ